MHKLESFALSCGSKIEKPKIEKQFYPITDKKFLCISQKAEAESKSYDFFDDVVFHIKPYLDKEGISILEIGQSKKAPIFYCKNLSHLRRTQIAYVISKSLMYIGNYNLYANISSHFNKDTICVSNNDYTETFRPYWGKDNCLILTPETESKPSLAPQEHPKTINEIHPEEVASNILDKLNIPHGLNKISTVFVGEEYKNTIIDLVPGLFNLQAMNVNGAVNIRMDKNFDLNFLQQCSTLEKINIVTDKIIPVEYLNLIKDKLQMISFFMDKKTTSEDIKQLESVGKPMNLLCKDQKNINKIRFKFIDYDIKLYGKKTKKDLKTKTFSDLKFLSKRNVIANGTVFNSYLSLSLGANTFTVKDQKEFWEDLPFCRVFRESS